jgi:hypothetical protein
MASKTKTKGGFGDPTKLTTEKFSARAKRSTLRKDPPENYKKGGGVKAKS